MASGGGGYYYDQSAAYYLPAPAPRATSFHLFVFLATASLLGATSLYSRYESAVESLVDQVRFAVVLSPLLLLLAVQYWAATAGPRARGGGLSSLLVGDRQVSWYGGGWGGHQKRDGAGESSPWGVALALALVLLLVSYQSCFRDLWFPLISRR
ncbi:hypothetical protein BS78_K132600 [Paspalum vaginatum]|uniref:Uncharacterized protein n=1 Tax=Paspalum vaginatum TaxID=158149 RepID=A0A9W8CDS6_9POAL|nr:hypothetical protein BS78_K132600 [Paspalum vaginatum]KAJ1254037.1 hypothetical protein BS78_K132600 [Paspalum vaginatum]